MTILNRSSNPASENVRMGPLALFTLTSVICLAVLAVLAVSTANATMALAQRRADATTQLYLDEAAAQAFLASLDTGKKGTFTRAAVKAAKQAALESVSAEDTELTITTSLKSRRTLTASFSCGDGRQLDITLYKKKDGSISVRRWRMMAVVNDEPTIGNLFGGF